MNPGRMSLWRRNVRRAVCVRVCKCVCLHEPPGLLNWIRCSHKLVFRLDLGADQGHGWIRIWERGVVRGHNEPQRGRGTEGTKSILRARSA
eukprot:5639214-Pleurochrysis_carterae.AAC.6